MSNAEQANENNVLHIGPHEQMQKSKTQMQATELLDAIRQVSMEHLRALVRRVFDSVDDSLFELADKADNNTLQTLYFDAMREVRIKRDAVEARFHDQVQNAFRRFLQPVKINVVDRALPIPAGADSLQLVDHDELEETLAIDTMVAKTAGTCAQALQALNQRLKALFKGREIAENDNPMTPAAVCAAYREAMRELDSDIRVKLILYKLFDKHVMGNVARMYDEVNALLVQHGILPNLRLTPSRSRGAGAVRRRRGEEASGPVNPYDRHYDADDGTDAHSQIFQLLQGLLSLRKSGAPAVAVPTAYASSGDVLQALSALQSINIPELHAAGGEGAARGDAIRTRLIGHFVQVDGSGQARGISQIDDDTIDVISMLFDFILDDGSLPDSLKALIARLQIPMLKVAILDKTFFSRKAHPARRLLNQLAKAAVEWAGDAAPDDNRLYAKIESVVTRILEEFTDNVDLFAELLDDFSGFVEQENRYYEVIEQRTTQASQGKEKLDVAKHMAAREIEARTQGRRIAAAAQRILFGPWKDVLVFSFLKDGADSEGWAQVLSTMDTLLWSAAPKTSELERQKLIKTIPQLLRDLRTSLVRMSIAPEEMEGLFKELELCHVACLRGEPPPMAPPPEPLPAAIVEVVREEPQAAMPMAPDAPAAEPVAAVPAATVAAEAVDRPAPPAVEQAADDGTPRHERYMRELRQIRIGTWYDVAADDGAGTRSKLSWISEITSKCLFVNRRGLKVTEMPMYDLAEAIRCGRVLPVQTGPIFDRALDAVVNALK